MPGAPLSLPEREEISVALIEDRSVSQAVIARRIGRHRTTVTRGGGQGGRGRYGWRWPRSGGQRAWPASVASAGGHSHCDRVTQELTLGRSPVAIWADLVAEGATEDVRRDHLRGDLRRCPRREAERLPAHETQAQAPPSGAPRVQTPGPCASPWPGPLNERGELGHRADQIIGKSNRSSMLA